eukprot:TRINITY_DN16757_c0_g1_i1.p1 TRINITY_DN16757_c0_g1~~TRINITY_DN16757_c0_g1_i1.p1  ORF type:complete len:272 (+),score=67.26 TRINITY_DN16757_c0_g1_i1:66-818(+)
MSPTPENTSLTGKALSRLSGMQLLKCLDADGSGTIDKVVLSRSLQLFDEKIFTDECLADLFGTVAPEGEVIVIKDLEALVPEAQARKKIMKKKVKKKKEKEVSITQIAGGEPSDWKDRPQSHQSTRTDWSEVKGRSLALSSAEEDLEKVDRVNALIGEGDALREEQDKLLQEYTAAGGTESEHLKDLLPYISFQMGDHVEHPKLGGGKIVGVEGNGEGTRYQIAFDNDRHGCKWLIAKMAKFTLSKEQPE